jgi:hypothetical protein
VSAPRSDAVCRVVARVTGRMPREVEFVQDADPRNGWLVRAWLDDSSLRDYRLNATDGPEGTRDELVEDRFERWPPADIRGRIQRCRC